MAQRPLPTYERKTFTYKHVQGKDILLNVFIRQGGASKGPRPAVLYFHGGYVITGDRTSVANWLFYGCLNRDYIFISADYRVLPESTGLDIATDITAAWNWVAHDLNGQIPSLVDPARMAVAGSSGGGYCALLGGTQLANPIPKAVFLIYPMADVAATRYWTRVPLPGLPEADAGPLLAEIEARIQRGEVSTGAAFVPTESPLYHPRFNEMRILLQEGLFVDYLSGVKGLGKRIGEVGVEKAVPEGLRSLFPTHFTVTKEFPPLVVIHGDSDKLVDQAESVKLVEKAKSLGLKFEFFDVKGQDHGFENEFEDLEDGSRERGDPELALARSLEVLEDYLER